MKGRFVFLLSLLCVAQALPLSLNGATHKHRITRSKRHVSREHDIADKEVRTIISAIVDAILDGDRKKRSEIPEEEDELEDISNPLDISGDSESGHSETQDNLVTNKTVNTGESTENSGSGSEDDASGQQNTRRSVISKNDDDILNKLHALNTDTKKDIDSDRVNSGSGESSIVDSKRDYLEGSGSGDKQQMPAVVVPETRTSSQFSKKTSPAQDTTASGSGQLGNPSESSGSGGNADAGSANDDETVTDDVIKENAGFIEETPDVEQRKPSDVGRIKRDEDALEIVNKREKILRENLNSRQNTSFANITSTFSNNAASIPLEKGETIGIESGSGSGNVEEDLMEDTLPNTENATLQNTESATLLTNFLSNNTLAQKPINSTNSNQLFFDVKNVTNNTINNTVIETSQDDLESGSGSGSPTENVKRNKIAKDEPDPEETDEDNPTNPSTGLFDAIHKSLSNSSETKESAGDALREADSPDASGSGVPWDDSSGYGFGSTGGDKREAINKESKTDSEKKFVESLSSGSGVPEIDAGSGTSDSENTEKPATSSNSQKKQNEDAKDAKAEKKIQNKNLSQLQGETENFEQSLFETSSGSASGSESGSGSSADVSIKTQTKTNESLSTINQSESGSGSGDMSSFERKADSAPSDGQTKVSNLQNNSQTPESFSSGDSEKTENDENPTTGSVQENLVESADKNSAKNEESKVASSGLYNTQANGASSGLYNTQANDSASGLYNTQPNEFSSFSPLSINSSSANTTNSNSSSNIFGSVTDQTAEQQADEGSATEASADEEEEGKETGESQRDTGEQLANKRGKIIEEIVSDMAKAAIQSVEVDDSNTVVKKSSIGDVYDKGDEKKSVIPKATSVSQLSDPEMESSLKQLVRSILHEDISVRQNVERISTQREEDEEKLTQDILSVMDKGHRKSSIQNKDKILRGIKDFEGYVQALSQADSMNPSKHTMIARKLENDLLKRLNIPEESSEHLLLGEEKLLKDSELEFIKDKINDAKKKSEEFAENSAQNMDDVRKHTIGLLNPIIDTLPLKKEDIEGLARSISRSAWIKAVETRSDIAASKVRRDTDDIINIT